ncbi:hypothetical protein [Rhodococcoides fascians]|uniref:hypothetical protein n=1 Tax=Rhodococcoides fascians TaxID=1828 RepID=UPI0012D2A2FC|nr:hypothetical protein [Rhodococcus fascians]
MNADLAVAVLTSAGVCAIVSALIGGLFSRRKMSAEATSIITTAAGSFVEQVQADNATLRSENKDLKTQLEELRTEVAGLKTQLESIQRDTRATREAVEHPEEAAP